MKSLTDLNARVVYALTLAMFGVLIYELVYNAKEQGNPFSFKVRALLNRLVIRSKVRSLILLCSLP